MAVRVTQVVQAAVPRSILQAVVLVMLALIHQLKDTQVVQVEKLVEMKHQVVVAVQVELVKMLETALLVEMAALVHQLQSVVVQLLVQEN
jgi:hypothetical protein